ncbi:MAG: hypothetical protein CL581_05205 [Alteromonadaceae bacterium]|nr:hypothetical protein [Alteromonadaceae bacterium]
MLKHGRDNGTMEFIFAKGGTLTDLNYVMFGAHDDTWEPLIKAVAERDNSHPDIIRKQAQDPMFGVNPQTFQGAVPVNLAGGRQTAATGQKEARDLLAAQRVNQANTRVEDARAAGQQPRGRDLATRGQRMAGLAQGIRNIGAEKVMPAAQAGADKLQGMSERFNEGVTNVGNAMGRGLGQVGNAMGRGLGQARAFMGQKAGQAADAFSRKFPGAKQRMGEFMQGAGRHLRHGPRAAVGRGLERARNMRDRYRRDSLESGAGMKDEGLSSLTQLDDEEDRAKYMYPGQTEDRLKDINERRGATRAKMSELDNELRNQETYRSRVARLAGMKTPEAEAPEAQPDVPLPEPEETRFATEDPADQAAITDIPQEDEQTPSFDGTGPETEPPLPAGGTPTFDGGEPAAAGETATATPKKPTKADDLQYYDETVAPLFTDEEKQYGGRDMRRKIAQTHRRGGEFSRTDFPKSKMGDNVVAMLQRAGMTMAEAVATAQDAAQGNPQAKKKVEAAVGGEQTPTFDEQPLPPTGQELEDFALSSDKHEASWDSLLKGLNIR